MLKFLIFVILLLKIFDIVGPPDFLKVKVKRALKKYFQTKIIFNKVKLKKNAVYLFLPHGSTFFPALGLSILLDLKYPLFFINKWFLMIPGFIGLIKLIGGGYITSEKGNLSLALSQTVRPLILYPNGAKEVLYNSSKNQKKRIFKIRKKIINQLSNRNIHVILIKNESKCFYFHPFIIKFYTFINKYIDIGIPFPLPQYNNKKIKIKIFKAIRDINKLYNKIWI